MNTAIPNPSKTITLNYSAETIKEVVKNLHLYLKSNGKDGYTKESEDEISNEQKRFLIDNDLTLTKMQQSVFLCQWKVVSDLI
jgi:hypothetical protein